jgi:hypothetical protein
MLGLEIDLQDLTVMAEQMEPNMDQLYGFLSEEAKDAIARFEDLTASLRSPLEADQELFDEIERFLREQRDKGEEL